MSNPSRRRRANAAYVRKDPAKWKNTGWTSVPNSIIRDPDMPPEEAWAWAWLASHDGEFEVSGKKLYEANNHLGRNRAYELLSNLERRGLLLRTHEYDPEAGVPYIQYDLQPVPAPEDKRTWEPPKAKTRTRAPHPGSKAARATRKPVDNPETAGQKGFPTGRESAGGGQVPDRAGIPSDQDFPDRAGTRGVIPDRAGIRTYIEKKTNQPTTVDQEPSGAGHSASKPGWLVGETSKPQPDMDSRGARFLASLPPTHQPDVQAFARLTPKVEALLRDWSESSLRARLTDGTAGAVNPPGVVIHRLESIPVPAAGRPTSSLPPVCGKCHANPPDPISWRVVVDAEGVERECPRCHPNVMASAGTG